MWFGGTSAWDTRRQFDEWFRELGWVSPFKQQSFEVEGDRCVMHQEYPVGMPSAYGPWTIAHVSVQADPVHSIAHVMAGMAGNKTPAQLVAEHPDVQRRRASQAAQADIAEEIDDRLYFHDDERIRSFGGI